jgi:hypothetical protein
LPKFPFEETDEVLKNSISVIELSSNGKSAWYDGKLLNNILSECKQASHASPSTFWIWSLVEPAKIS